MQIRLQENLRTCRTNLSAFQPVGIDPLTGDPWHPEIDAMTGNEWLPDAEAADAAAAPDMRKQIGHCPITGEKLD